MIDSNQLRKAADILTHAEYAISFTGAGISVESGVPPFRGADGIWSKYDPNTLDLGFFYQNPTESWIVIRELFYNYFGNAKANPAHLALAKFEQKGIIKSIITQNIDNLHQQAGSQAVFEFHGNSQKLLCTKCHTYYKPGDIDFEKLPPYCECSGLIKPDFIFFGEGIPMEAYQLSVSAARKCDVVVVVGSTGEVMPAAQMPFIAKENGATIIEINPEKSKFSGLITDIHLQGKAGEVLSKLYVEMFNEELI